MASSIALLLPHWGLIGGSERYAAGLARGLRARGHRISVVCGEAGPRTDLPEVDGVGVCPVLLDPRPQGRALATLAGEVRRLDADHFVVLGARSSRILPALARLAPTTRYLQDHVAFCPGLNKMREDRTPCTQPLGDPCLRAYLGRGCSGFKRSLWPGDPRAPLLALLRTQQGLQDLRACHRILVASNYMLGACLDAGLPRESLARLPYPTPPQATPSPLPGATQEFLATSDAPLLLTPARLTLPDKGVDVLLTALGKLGTPFRAVIAGEGPARAWLEHKSEAEGLSRWVHFSGWLSQGQLATLQVDSRATVMPSIWDEPFGLVGLEAMSWSRPVVAFDVGGVRDWLLPGTTGLLAERDCADSLATALDRILREPELAARLGRGGQQRADSCFRADAHFEALGEHLGILGNGMAPDPSLTR